MTRRAEIARLALIAVLAAGCGSSRSSAKRASATTATTTTTTSTTTSTTNSSPSPGTANPSPGGTGTTPPSGQGGIPPTARGFTPTTGGPVAGTVRLTEKDDGTSVRVVRGTTIVVVLSSTYWKFPTGPDPSVLSQIGPVTTTPAPAHTCLPGAGCGTVSVTYRAAGVGQAQISASRTTCGEALACKGRAGFYSVQVVVTTG